MEVSSAFEGYLMCHESGPIVQSRDVENGNAFRQYALAADNDQINAFCVDSTHVYWSGAKVSTPFIGIRKCSHVGPNTFVTVLNGLAQVPYDICESGLFLYYSVANEIRVVGKDGTGDALLAAASGYGRLATDGTDVFWHESNTVSPKLRKVPCAGGAVTILASIVGNAQARPMLIGTDVYWLSDTPGTISKIPKAGGGVTTIASTPDLTRRFTVTRSSFYKPKRRFYYAAESPGLLLGSVLEDGYSQMTVFGGYVHNPAVSRALTVDIYGRIYETRNGDLRQLIHDEPLGQRCFDGAQPLTTAVNRSGATVLQSRAVFFDGVGGFKLAKADALATAKFSGLAAGTGLLSYIDDKLNGEIQTEGVMEVEIGAGIFDTAPSPGDTLYLSPINAGNLTPTAPTADGHIVVPVGMYIGDYGPNRGKMLIRPGDPDSKSGSYIPTGYAGTNATIAPDRAVWFRVGNMVHVDGVADVTVAGGGSWDAAVQVPVPSAIGSQSNGSGSGAAYTGGTMEPVQINPLGGGSDKMYLSGIAAGAGNWNIRYSYSYRVE